MSYSYYENQLKERLTGDVDYLTIKLHGEHESTKNLSLNKDSLKALLEFAVDKGILDGYTIEYTTKKGDL